MDGERRHLGSDIRAAARRATSRRKAFARVMHRDPQQNSIPISRPISPRPAPGRSRPAERAPARRGDPRRRSTADPAPRREHGRPRARGGAGVRRRPLEDRDRRGEGRELTVRAHRERRRGFRGPLARERSRGPALLHERDDRTAQGRDAHPRERRRPRASLRRGARLVLERRVGTLRADVPSRRYGFTVTMIGGRRASSAISTRAQPSVARRGRHDHEPVQTVPCGGSPRAEREGVSRHRLRLLLGGAPMHFRNRPPHRRDVSCEYAQTCA